MFVSLPVGSDDKLRFTAIDLVPDVLIVDGAAQIFAGDETLTFTKAGLFTLNPNVTVVPKEIGDVDQLLPPLAAELDKTPSPLAPFGSATPEELVVALNGAGLQGVHASVTKFRPKASKFSDEACHGVNFTVTDPNALRSVSLGIELIHQLRKLHPQQWRGQKTLLLLGNQSTFSLLHSGASRADVVESYQAELDAFTEARRPYLLY